MIDEEHKMTVPEAPAHPAPETWTLENAPTLPKHPEEVLVDKLAETAESVTSELKDLEEALTPPEAPAVAAEVSIAAPEAPVEAVAALELPAETAAAAELPAEPVEVAAPVEELKPFELPPVSAAEPASQAQEAPKAAQAAALEGSSDDRLMSALAWLSIVILQLPIVSLIQLLSPSAKDRPFQRHHAVTSLLFYAAGIAYEILAGIAYAILGLVTLGIGFACLWVIFFLPHLLALYYALQAYNGKRVELPALSSLGRQQGWL